MMNTAFHPHRGFLDAYDVQILNHADHLEPILRDRGILDRVSTVFSIGVGAGHPECQLARELGVSLAYVERSPPMIEAIWQNIAAFTRPARSPRSPTSTTKHSPSTTADGLTARRYRGR